MKLIIDIPEDDYKECKFRKDLLLLGGEPTDLTFNMRMETLIANGTPLEDIKAEIQNIDLVYEKNGRTTIMKNFDDIKSEIFDILDKHIKENKE